jgi:DNA repair exonuclease SbcCD ATPase subunit
MDYSDSELLEANKLKKKLELILDGVLKCPKCGEKFVVDNELKLTYEEALEIKLEVDSKAKELAEEVNVLSIKISEANKELKAAKEQNLKYEACEHDINKQNKLIEVEEYEIKALNVKIAKKKVEIEDLKSGKQRKERIEELKQRKRDVLKKYNECREVLKVADDELNMLKFWQFNMGKSGFQTYLANKSIKRLEGTINNYLDKMKIDYRVQIEPYKVLKSGDVREKIDCFVSCNGYDWQNFMTFSGGERQRIILAGILAIQKLINDSLGANGLNMLIMDETLWQMDNVGTVSAIRILERIGITILITTQNIEEPEKIFENYLKVVKIDGVSKFQS